MRNLPKHGVFVVVGRDRGARPSSKGEIRAY